ncbi:MAG: T9SS type A sorting domain-containing protein [Owenweeksia sp.]|nr:T9SS type A sorting domain-containing protein [Owenweeksia sp.]
MRYLTFALLLLGFMAGGQSAERQVIATMGGSASSGSLYASHTIGQPFSGSATAGSITLTQGFEQGAVNDISLEEESLGKLSIFPNPVKRSLVLEVSQWEGSQLGVSLMDVSGKVLLRKEWRNLNGQTKRSLNVADLAPGEYFLR